MSSETLVRAAQQSGCTRSGSLVGRVAAIVEVLLAFALVHLAYRSFKHFTPLGRLEGATGLNFSPGATMILFTVAVLLLGKRSFADYGLTMKDSSYHLNVGLLWAAIVVAAAGLVLALSPVRLDPLHPPDLPKAVLGSCGAILLTLFLALFLMRDRVLLRRVPATLTLLVIGGLLFLPLIVAGWFRHPLLAAALTVL
jgi:hypothetical protein